MPPWQAIFYSPHQDDEAIGFAGAIAEHKQAGRPVYLVQYMDGHDPGLLALMNGTPWPNPTDPPRFCYWHQTYHNFNLTMDQLAWARRVEFVASAKALGVDKVFFVNDAQGLDSASLYTDYGAAVSQMAAIIQHFEQLFPGASHKLISGAHDLYPFEGVNVSIVPQSDPRNIQSLSHRVGWDAAATLLAEIDDFAFYRVYIYYWPANMRSAPHITPLANQWSAAKCAAVAEYKMFDPSKGRYAIGYHSAPDLLDNACLAQEEYLDFLP